MALASSLPRAHTGRDAVLVQFCYADASGTEERSMFQKLHHVAYRCRDAQETVEFYTKVLGLKYAAGEQSPEGARAVRGRGRPHPYLLRMRRRQLYRVLRPAQLAANAGRSEHAELGQPHRLRGAQHGRATGRQAPSGSGGRRRARAERPQLLPVDLLLRPERHPAGDDGAHRGTRRAATGWNRPRRAQLAAWNARKQRKYGVPA